MDQDILKRLENLEKRLDAIEGHLGITTTNVVSQQSAPPPPPSYRIETPQVRVVDGTKAGLSAAFSGGSQDIESYIGRWWLGIIGIVAILFGAGFFLKYAFENNLISPGGRVLIEVAAGLLFIFVGEFFRNRIPKYSYIISGGGLALLYLSVYGAHWFYHLVSLTTAGWFMVAVTVFGVILAIVTNGMELGALAIAGGFLTPFLLKNPNPNDLAYFGYVAILNFGVFATAFFKKWHTLFLLGFIGTVVNVSSWYISLYAPEKLFFMLYWLTLFFVLYALAGVISSIVSRKLSDERDLFILTINPAWFFGWCYFLLKPQYENSLGFLAAGLAALYILFAYLNSSLHKENSRATLFLAAIALLFLTLAIPLQLDQNAITIAWAIEAAILFVLGAVLQLEKLRWFGIGVLAVALIRLFGFDIHPVLTDFVPIFNKRFFTFFVALFAMGSMGYVSAIYHSVLQPTERGIKAILWTAFNILFLIAITLEISAYFDARIATLEQRAVEKIQQNTPLAESGYNSYPYDGYEARYQVRSGQEYRSLMNQRNASISVFWTLHAILLIIVGMVFQNALLRWSALALFGVTIGKVFIYDLASLKTPYRIISFTVLGFILLGASYLYFRNQKKSETNEELIKKP